MTGPSLVVLAAGRGVRFGGPKQLVEIRDDGSTITDVLVRRAAAAGVARAVIVIHPAIEEATRAHLDRMGETPIPVQIVLQRQHRGTADAVLAARNAVDGSIVVVNADDLYPGGAFAAITRHLSDAPSHEHAVVGFRVDRTLNGPRPEMRALLTVDDTGALVAAREGSVEKDGGLRFRTTTAVEPLRGDELISMNMWGFRPTVFEALAAAVGEVDEQGPPVDPPIEVYLPDVVAKMIASGATIRVLPSEDACLGITYPEDVAAVRAAQP